MIIGIPWLILRDSIWQANEFSLVRVFGIAIFIFGLIILFLSHRHVYRPSQWTRQEIPFDEPNQIVTHGIYRHTRNPMMDGLYLMLLGETLFFESWALFYFLTFVVIGSVTVIIFWEEPRLEKKFGDTYREYKKNVARFIPQIF